MWSEYSENASEHSDGDGVARARPQSSTSLVMSCVRNVSKSTIDSKEREIVDEARAYPNEPGDLCDDGGVADGRGPGGEARGAALELGDEVAGLQAAVHALAGMVQERMQSTDFLEDREPVEEHVQAEEQVVWRRERVGEEVTCELGHCERGGQLAVRMRVRR